MSTIALTWLLVLKPRQSSSPAHVTLPTQNIFKRLALRAVETNLVSLAVHLSVVILYAKHDAVYFWYSAPAFTLVKVYAVSLLATLNSRASEAHSLSREGSDSSDFRKFSAALGGSRIEAGMAGRQGQGQVRSGGVTFDFERHVRVSGPADQGQGLEQGQSQDEFPVYTPHFSFGPTPALFPLASMSEGEAERRRSEPGEVEKGEVGVAIGSPGGEREEEHEMEKLESDKVKANMGWI